MGIGHCEFWAEICTAISRHLDKNYKNKNQAIWIKLKNMKNHTSWQENRCPRKKSEWKVCLLLWFIVCGREMATSIGIMDSAYFVGRNEILSWINNRLQLNLSRIEEVTLLVLSIIQWNKKRRKLIFSFLFFFLRNACTCMYFVFVGREMFFF